MSALTEKDLRLPLSSLTSSTLQGKLGDHDAMANQVSPVVPPTYSLFGQPENNLGDDYPNGVLRSVNFRPQVRLYALQAYNVIVEDGDYIGRRMRLHRDKTTAGVTVIPLTMGDGFTSFLLYKRQWIDLLWLADGWHYLGGAVETIV